MECQCLIGLLIICILITRSHVVKIVCLNFSEGIASCHHHYIMKEIKLLSFESFVNHDLLNVADFLQSIELIKENPKFFV
jgi:hypothetical protein